MPEGAPDRIDDLLADVLTSSEMFKEQELKRALKVAGQVYDDLDRPKDKQILGRGEVEQALRMVNASNLERIDKKRYDSIRKALWDWLKDNS